MKIKTRPTRRHVTHSVDIDDVTVELTFEPYDEDSVLAERVGDQLVVAYLVHDNDGSCNPMTDSACQGTLYTRGLRLITDDERELTRALGLDSYGSPDIDKAFTTAISPNGDEVTATLRELAAGRFEHTLRQDFDLVQRYIEAECEQFPLIDDFWANDGYVTQLRADLNDANGFFCDEVERLALCLYPEFWKEIVGPFVVPMHYSNGYETTISPNEWNGDPDDLPNAVWVADKESIESIESTPLPQGLAIRWLGSIGVSGSTLHAVVSFNGADVFDAGAESDAWGRALRWAGQHYGGPSAADLRRTAVEYAAGVCDEYAKWASGEVFGCVVETFDLGVEGAEPDELEWVPHVNHDSCWGFIGHDYAMESLRGEFFEVAVRGLKGNSP